MSLLTVILIGLGVSTDACAVALSCGIVYRKTGYGHALKAAAFFGFFQALMPLIGYYAGRAVYGYIHRVSNWVAFGLLALIGGHMMLSSRRAGEEAKETEGSNPFSTRSLLLLAVVTSVDALAVGVSFAMVSANIFSSVSLIGGITFVLAFFSVLLGKRVGKVFRSRAEFIGGLLLVLIGLEIAAGPYLRRG